MSWWVLGTGLLAAVLLMTAVWLVSVLRRDAGIIDVFWGPGFVALAWLYLREAAEATWRGRLVVVLVTLWGLRLSLHLLRRNWGQPEDHRYRNIRRRWGRWFPLLSLPGIFWLQALLLWVVASPLFQVQRSSSPQTFQPLDALGLLLFSGGMVFEALGDWQLERFRRNPENRGRVLDRGLWRYTRHPNYFGDAMVWWGLGCLALATEGALWTIIGPLLMTVLLRWVSGVKLLEQTLSHTRPGYADYVRRTSTFFPWFPHREPRGTP